MTEPMDNKLAILLPRIEEEFGMTPSSRASIYGEQVSEGPESIEAFVARTRQWKIANDSAPPRYVGVAKM